MAMAIERLKFRCYKCNQLMSVPQTKAGSVIACPKCRADLLIPGEASAHGDDPLGTAQPNLAPAREGPILGDFTEIASILPAELANLRPEDVRVEAEVFEQLTRPRAPEPASLETELDLSALGEDRPPPFVESGSPAAVETYQTPAPAPPVAPTQIVAPPIAIEPPSILPKNQTPKTIREVVLPASVVLAWSFFGLIGILVSFIAGLTVGHFLWK